MTGPIPIQKSVFCQKKNRQYEQATFFVILGAFMG